MLLNLERYDEAEPVLLRCADEARLAGGRNQIASAMLELGHLYLRTGANDDAREVLTTALKGYEFLAAAGVWWSHLGLGAAELAAGNVAEAERHFLAIDEYQQSEHFRAYGWYGQLQFSLALCAAARDDWEGCAHWVEQGAAIAETERRDPDTARIATDVGRIAEAHGRAPLAIDAYRVGLSQWEGLDRETEAAAVRERLAALASDDGEP